METLETCTTINSRERDLLLAVKEVVRRFFPDATILLYGSVARGTQGPESDYDVLILTEHSFSSKQEEAITDAIYDLELDHGVLISTMMYTHHQRNAPARRAMPLHDNVEKDAVLL